MSSEVVQYKPERDYWNIVKGVGMIAIIIGHSCMDPVANYVYMFHIQLFFFVSGYLYCESKYGDDPWLNLKNKLKGLWLPYFIIISIFVLLHNVISLIGMQPEGTMDYSLKDMLVRICYAMFGVSDEFLAGPVWFLRTLAMAMIIFGFIVVLSRLIEAKTNFAFKIIVQLILIIALTVLGYPLIASHTQLPADMQIAFEMMPFIWVGYFLRNYIGSIDKLLNIIVGLIAFVIVGIVSSFQDLDMAMGNIFPYMHIVAFLGIYGCLSLSKLLCKWNISRKVFSIIGSISLYIMVVHFVVIRAIDKVTYIVCDKPAYELMTNIIYWIIYVIIIVAISVTVSFGIKKAVDAVKTILTKAES